MIIFEKILYRNFLSSGNRDTVIHLNTDKMTCIRGKNGSGKSSVLDAITFCLFGKPFRRINKPQLVNSINKKDLFTEVYFTIGQNKYVVQRGIKPNVFEVIINGEKLQQDAAVKDTQKHLEQNILKMSYRSFTQIVILGSATFVPFMQLPPVARREVIENLLDIQSFSIMFALVKDRIRGLKEQVKDLQRDEKLTRERIRIQESYINDLKSQSVEKIGEINSEIEELNSVLANYQIQEEVLSSEINLIHESNEKLTNTNPSQKLRKLQSYGGKIENKIERIVKENEFYESNDVCQSCHQTIDPLFKKDKITKNKDEISSLNDGLSQLKVETDKLIEIISNIEKNTSTIHNLMNSLTSIKTKRESTEKQIKRFKLDVQKLTNSENNLSREEGKLSILLEDLDIQSNKYQEVYDSLEQHEIVYNLLKDNGVKTIIIKQYLPLMNKLISNYLREFDFPINFTLDEEFNETVESPIHRDFSYLSFSEGEKQRINLSILLMMREIAKLKQSVNTNILFFDEVFDSSLDSSGTEELMRVLKYLVSDLNVFVVSHKLSDSLAEKFDNVLTFEKIKGFSVMS
jgi:DNA repair exonuclease SbcCD ATPase subunit